ncbi:hypothetical protein HDU98_006978 [Podochytrium sp. JEL0797]|nr:hypothetical protein HDU98_006978 [Podochytrium sp. JEL0797]
MRLLWTIEVPVWVPWGVETLINLSIGLTSIVIAALYVHQDKIIYPSAFPAGSREVVPTPDQYRMPDYENVFITTPDKVKITGYAIKYRPQLSLLTNEQEDPSGSLRLRKPDGSKHDVAGYTVLYCHANAGNMGHRLPFAGMLRNRGGVNVFMLSYRGYGKSEGAASEKGMKIDSQAALDWISNHEELGKTKIIVYGQSIGGAVAIDLAARNPERIVAVMIENTFLTLPKLIPSAMPAMKYLAFLCHQVWNSEAAVQKIPETVPMLFLSGTSDELIPQKHMIELAKLARRSRGKAGSEEEGSALVRDRNGVRWVEFQNGTHNDTCMQAGYYDTIGEFLEELKEGRFGKLNPQSSL